MIKSKLPKINDNQFYCHQNNSVIIKNKFIKMTDFTNYLIWKQVRRRLNDIILMRLAAARARALRDQISVNASIGHEKSYPYYVQCPRRIVALSTATLAST
jgi:hypothetical protein